MFNQFASLPTRFLSNRTVHFGIFFLLALGCEVFGQSILSEMSLSNVVGSLNLNGGRNYERLPQNHVGMAYIVMIRLMLRRLTKNHTRWTEKTA